MMMRSELIPLVGAQADVRRRRGSPDDLAPSESVGQLSEAQLGEVVDLSVARSSRVLRRLRSSPRIDLPPAA